MKVVCLGDSNTYGQNVRADESWPAVLASMTSWDVRNEGVCRETTRDGLARWRDCVALHKPDWVIIQFGHNDCNVWDDANGIPRVLPEAFVANLEEMRARVRVIGAKTLTLKPHRAPGKSQVYNERLRVYREQMSGLALREGDVSVLADGYGLHPDPNMHKRYANLVVRVIG